MIKVYVQELATYNNCCGVGKWINIDNFDIELDELYIEATQVLKNEGYYYGVDAEEYEIFDWECEADINLNSIYQDTDTLKKLNELLLECDDTEIQVIAYLLDNGYSIKQIDRDKINEVRVYDSWDEAIEEYIEYFLCIESDSTIYNYIDYSKIQRDLEIENYCESNGKIYYNS